MKKTILVVAAILAAGMASAQDGVFGSNVHFLSAPCRILDTRITVEGVTINNRVIAMPNWPGTGVFHHGETRRYLAMAGATCYDDTNRRPIGMHATGILVNVTAVGATAQGRLVLYDSTLTDPMSLNFREGWTPGFSSLNFPAGAAETNFALVKLGQDQGYNAGEQILPDLAVYAHVADGGTVHVLIDLFAVLYDDTYPVPEQ